MVAARAGPVGYGLVPHSGERGVLLGKSFQHVAAGEACLDEQPELDDGLGYSQDPYEGFCVVL
jgi:hypothetical protein